MDSWFGAASAGNKTDFGRAVVEPAQLGTQVFECCTSMIMSPYGLVRNVPLI